MHRDGADPENMTAVDFLCDFCGNPYHEDRPLVEGHRGSCICSNCLTLAYAALALHRTGEPLRESETCILCLTPKTDEPHWRSPLHEEKVVCVSCTKQAAGVLHKDGDVAWKKPV